MKIFITKNKVTVNGRHAKKIWTGSARHCFIAEGIIVKISRDQDTFMQSNTELRIWPSISRRDRKYFAKPIAGVINKNGGWIAQRLIKFKRGRRPRSAWRLVAHLAKKYGILNDCFCTVDGFRISCNWGIRENGLPVIYDWGF